MLILLHQILYLYANFLFPNINTWIRYCDCAAVWLEGKKCEKTTCLLPGVGFIFIITHSNLLAA